MFRRWFVKVLLALQLLPALALVPGQADALTLEIDHALVHQSGQGHHHDDSLAFQLDDVEAPLPHAHHDGGHHSALPFAIPDLHLPPAEPSAHLCLLAGRLPDPHLEGPLRPPRTAV
ncbi:hypothetical protein HZ992_13135 [Rhizobacter sp. AJA081-3]|jgi:hypothetical protein|uniref:hypothetical protein n=1 Tax=Rhizobacter sp. AJA081-3 TaxID=2753607 RepID=UPI001AE0B006|nr:hypothetical protein [Rhizobacter sp. AJA081-3]QTN21149.1 hypothetical protein HZ992_13135 [Rhizobacter sp. AJA081-3]